MMGRPAPFLTSHMVGQEDQKNEQQNNVPNLKKNNAAAGYQGPVKIELLKGAGPLEIIGIRSLTQVALNQSTKS